MSKEKQLMSEAAILYYQKKCTQQEIADVLNLSRQTVSKLLNDAIKENVVEIKIHSPQKECYALQERICQTFNIQDSVVCSVSGKSQSLRELMTVRAAANYLVPLIEKGGQKIAVSWGRTIEALIKEFPDISTFCNLVFPLFGATDNVNSCFLSNEIARNLADKIGADINFAWFPYLTDSTEDCALLKKTSYYKKLKALWENIDIAIVGIGNTSVLELFEKSFGYNSERVNAIGDVATQFFTRNGELLNLYKNSLCASPENLRQAKKTVAVACGADKTDAIIGALRTGLIDVLVTDEYSARQILEEI